jgi:transcriptional regulator GlxA family with amidase domain
MVNVSINHFSAPAASRSLGHSEDPRPRQMDSPDPAIRPDADRRLRELARLRRARDRIDREYALPQNVDSLARGAEMSTAHFSRRFRLAYGETPHFYLMTRRIERAMALLRRGDLSVTDVCRAVGYVSLGSFSTRFAELVGAPPSVYWRGYAFTTLQLPPCVERQLTRPIRDGRPFASRA